MTIQIIPATIQQAEPVAKLLLEAMEDLIYFYIGKNDKEKALAFLENQFKLKNTIYSHSNSFVAKKDEEVVGVLVAYNGRSHFELQQELITFLKLNHNFKSHLNPETEADEFYIDALSVNPDMRGQKIGSKLISFAENHAKENNYKHIGLLVDKENPAAKRLYHRLGFVFINAVKLEQHCYEHLQKKSL
ncbi:MAG: GNAT family N-acetyltransferase [Flavobacteriaceae bacterium]